MFGCAPAQSRSQALRHWPILILFALLALPSKSRAQCADSDFPEPGRLTAAPTRPTESFPADPIQAGVLQYESGWTHSWISGDSSQNALPSMIRYGIWCNLEIRWNANAYLRDTSGSATSAGFGDNFFGGQYRIVRESSHVPSIALGYTLKFPTADPVAGLGSGKTDHMLTMMVGKTVHGFSVISNLCYFSIGQSTGGNNARSELTLAVSHSLKGKLGAVGEVYHDSRLNSANVAFTNSTWALTYNLRPRVVIDAGTYQAFNSGPGVPGRSVFVGLTYAVGSFYKPRHNHPAIAE